jgi:acid phosphatase
MPRAGLLGVLLALLVGCASADVGTEPAMSASPSSGASAALPHFDHIVVVMEENHAYDQIIGSADAPYINSLAQRGALFTDSHAVAHPSQPNYLALFAGSTFDLSSDDCPQHFSAPNLGAEAIAHHLSFVGYSESLPQVGYSRCTAGTSSQAPYARKHNPWADFSNVPGSSSRPFSSFPSNFSQLPAIAFVVPNQQHDMHYGSVASADLWLKQHLSAYAEWASAHNSLLIVTWDEDDDTAVNHIPTLFVGAHVKVGTYDHYINHYDVLHTIEALDGLAFTGEAANATTIADVWTATTTCRSACGSGLRTGGRHVRTKHVVRHRTTLRQR